MSRRRVTAVRGGLATAGVIAAHYAPVSDWKLDWPEDEHGRTATPWIRHRATRADAAVSTEVGGRGAPR